MTHTSRKLVILMTKGIDHELSSVGFTIANGGINVARIAGSTGTFNLNGGLFQTLNIASSTGSNAVINLNGGIIAPTTNAQTTTFFQGLSGAFIRNGGMIIDVTNLSLTVAQPLLHSTGSRKIAAISPA